MSRWLARGAFVLIVVWFLAVNAWLTEGAIIATLWVVFKPFFGRRKT